MPKILDGKLQSLIIKEHLKQRVEVLNNNHITPSLVVFTFPEIANNIYLKNQIKIGKEIGIKILEYSVNSLEDIIQKRQWHKQKPFIIQSPNNLNIFELNEYLNQETQFDLEGINIYNLGKIVFNIPEPNYIKPCTPQAILQLLSLYNIELQNKNVAIIGRSQIAGKPLSLLLTNLNANVTLCHSRTSYDKLIQYCEIADIIISVTGQIDILKGWKAKPNQILIDVGINLDANKKLCGDFSKVTIENCYAYTPVPGGVGPMTVIELMRNTVEFWETDKNKKNDYHR